MLPSIAHELRDGVKAHRLRIEDRCKEHIGMVTFHPR
jgi:hypothetical protein